MGFVMALKMIKRLIVGFIILEYGFGRKFGAFCGCVLKVGIVVLWLTEWGKRKFWFGDKSEEGWD